jgi:hypothetical protein
MSIKTSFALVAIAVSVSAQASLYAQVGLCSRNAHSGRAHVSGRAVWRPDLEGYDNLRKRRSLYRCQPVYAVFALNLRLVLTITQTTRRYVRPPSIGNFPDIDGLVPSWVCIREQHALVL